jgi:hypothetical protein
MDNTQNFEEVTIFVSPELMESIKKMTDDENITKADLIRRALGLYYITKYNIDIN